MWCAHIDTCKKKFDWIIDMMARISPTRQLSIDFTRNLEEKSKQASPKDIEANLEASWPAPTAMSNCHERVEADGGHRGVHRRPGEQDPALLSSSRNLTTHSSDGGSPGPRE